MRVFRVRKKLLLFLYITQIRPIAVEQVALGAFISLIVGINLSPFIKEVEKIMEGLLSAIQFKSPRNLRQDVFKEVKTNTQTPARRVFKRTNSQRQLRVKTEIMRELKNAIVEVTLFYKSLANIDQTLSSYFPLRGIILCNLLPKMLIAKRNNDKDKFLALVKIAEAMEAKINYKSKSVLKNDNKAESKVMQKKNATLCKIRDENAFVKGDINNKKNNDDNEPIKDTDDLVDQIEDKEENDEMQAES